MANNKAEEDSSGVIIPDEQAQFNLYLNDVDRFGNMIGTVGVGLVYRATDEVEDIIFREQAHNITAAVDAQMNFEVAKTLANVNWLYVTAVSLFYFTSTERLKQLYQTLDLSKEYSKERIHGRELVVTGDMFKILGYILTAQGFDIIADSTLREEQITPPP